MPKSILKITNFFSRAKGKSNSWGGGGDKKKASGDVANLKLDTGAEKDMSKGRVIKNMMYDNNVMSLIPKPGESAS